MSKNKQAPLMDESPIVVYPSLAKLLGINEAIVLQQMWFWINVKKSNENETSKRSLVDGKWWVWNSYREWCERDFIWLSERGLQNVILNLEKLGILESRQGVENSYDRRKWYTVNREKLESLVESEAMHHTKNVSSHDTKNVPSNIQKMNEQYTESTKENNKQLPIAKATEQAKTAKEELPHIDYNAILTAIEKSLGIKATAAKRYATMLMGTATSGEWKECAMPKEQPVTAEELTAFCTWWRKKNPNLHLPTSAMRLQSELLSYRETINAPKRAKTPQDVSNNIFGGVS